MQYERNNETIAKKAKKPRDKKSVFDMHYNSFLCALSI